MAKVCEHLMGKRVRLAQDIDNYPTIIVGAGATGTVAFCDEEAVWVTLDQHEPALDEWENQLQVWEHEPGFCATVLLPA